MNQPRFPLFDRPPYDPELLMVDGMPTIIADDPDRDITDHEVIIEPHDARSDFCVSIPVRSVVSSIAGPAIEIGPFTLDTPEVAKLYNQLARHINRFPSEFKTGASA